MKKGETLEQEAARKREEAELPQRLGALCQRVTVLVAFARAMLDAARARNRSNAGGERNGGLEQ